MQLNPGNTAIDVGCGLGADASAMAQIVGPSGRAVGIDSSKGFVDRATQRYASQGAYLRFMVADASTIPFEDATVDAITRGPHAPACRPIQSASWRKWCVFFGPAAASFAVNLTGARTPSTPQTGSSVASSLTGGNRISAIAGSGAGCRVCSSRVV